MCAGSGLSYCYRGQPRCMMDWHCPPSPPHYQPMQCKCDDEWQCACYRGAFPMCTYAGWACN